MKIIQLTAENIKKLRTVEITPKGNMVRITGRNGSGKSSVLDAIWWALGGQDAIGDMPIRAGEARATIQLNLGELIVTRKFTGKGSTLTVENGAGAKFSSPQGMLDSLIGELSFDPLEFSRMKPAAQYEELKRIAKLEVDIDALDAENKRDFDRRTELNRQAREYSTRASGAVFGLKHPAMEAPVDIGELTAKLAKIAEHNAGIDTAARNAEAAKVGIERAVARIAELEKEIAELHDHISGNEHIIETAKSQPRKMDAEEVRAEIAEAQEKNAEHAKRKEAKDLETRGKAAEAEALDLTNRMAARDKRKAEAIQKAEMPVEGISLADRRVFLHGIPFDQASGAEQLKTSVAIAMAANPKLRVIRIKDGSLLDEEGMAMLQSMAEGRDFQVWVESVDTSGKIGIVMEDGEARESAAA